LPLQQAWFGPPQGEQLPPLQIVEVAVQRLPVQQGWPEPPQAAHTLVEQMAPVPHWVPQQG
jgi:hypothetical protein